MPLEENKRVVWARGLTPTDRGKLIRIGGRSGELGTLRAVEHLNDTTVLTLLVSRDLDHNIEIELYD